MAYMLSDFYCDGVVLDFPKGGTKSIIDALLRGVRKNGDLRLNAPVAKVLADDGATTGVELASGETIHAPIVVSNADLWTTQELLPKHPKLVDYFDKQAARVTRCDSFLHLHVGIDATGLPTDTVRIITGPVGGARRLGAAASTRRATWFWCPWRRCSTPRTPEGATSSTPTCRRFPASLSSTPPQRHRRDNNNSPLDKTQATEPFEDWEEFLTDGGYQSPAYREAKEQAVEVLWRAIERYVPDVRDRVKVALPATPLDPSPI